jgi:hypothetical protein
MFTNRFFVPQNDKVERTVFTSFPPSEAPDFTTQHDRVERIVCYVIFTFRVRRILKLRMTGWRG